MRKETQAGRAAPEVQRRLAVHSAPRDSRPVAQQRALGKLLVGYRARANLSQVDLAVRSGLSKRGIQDIEAGRRQRPHPSTLRALADALGLSPFETSQMMATCQRPLRGEGFTDTDSARREDLRRPSPNTVVIPSDVVDKKLVSLVHLQPDTAIVEHIAAIGLTNEFHRLALRGRHIASVGAIPGQTQALRLGLIDSALDLTIEILPFRANAGSLAQGTIARWIGATTVVVPMWWDDERRVAQWLDWPRYLLRIGGLEAIGRPDADLTPDLHTFDGGEPGSVEAFFGWARAFAAAWPRARDRYALLLLDPAFPITLADILCDPRIATFLPVGARLLQVLDRLADPGIIDDRRRMMGALFDAGAMALSSANKAADTLLARITGHAQDQTTKSELASELAHWADQVPSFARPGTTELLRAFDHLMAMVGRSRDPGLRLPTCTYDVARPLSTLTSLLPLETSVAAILGVLEFSHDIDTICTAAYCLSWLNVPQRQSLWPAVHQARRRIRAERETIFQEAWPIVERELLFVEADLGGEEAIEQFLTNLADAGGRQYEIAWNLRYYKWNAELAVRTQNDKLADDARHDSHLRPLWALISEMLLADSTSGASGARLRNRWPLDPRLWPGA